MKTKTERNELLDAILAFDCYAIERAIGDQDHATAKHATSYKVPDCQCLTGVWEGRIYADGLGWVYGGPMGDESLSPREVWETVAPEAFGEYP